MLVALLVGPRALEAREPGAGALAVRGALSPEETRTIRIFREAGPSVVHVTSISVRPPPTVPPCTQNESWQGQNISTS